MIRQLTGSGRIRQTLLAVLFWMGLALCVYVVKEHWRELRELLIGVGANGAVVVVLAFVLAWAAAVSSWRNVVFAYGDSGMNWPEAARQLALLLLGKYLPGGVWGFAARLADSASRQPLANMAAAGLTEQWFGLMLVTLAGSAGWVAAQLNAPFVLFGVIALPAVVMVSHWVMRKSLRGVWQYLPTRWRQKIQIGNDHVDQSSLWKAAALTTVQVVLMLAVVGFILISAFEVDVTTALAVAGAYGLAVTVGMLAIFVPGGILVRESVFVVLCQGWLTQDEAIVLAGGLRLAFTIFDLGAGLVALCMRLRRGANEK